jgi:3-hydroxyacyl-CoA dehydrogenase
MGGGITMNFPTAGIPVTIVEMTVEALDRGVATMPKNYENTVKRGKMDAALAEAAMGRLDPRWTSARWPKPTSSSRRSMRTWTSRRRSSAGSTASPSPGAILASNTSYLDVNESPARHARPEAVLGMHFFSPANVMKLLEVVRGKETGKQQLATVMALSVKIGKVPVVSGVCHGFIGNRMLSPRQAQAHALIMEGANYWEVDEALLEFGFPMGRTRCRTSPASTSAGTAIPTASKRCGIRSARSAAGARRPRRASTITTRTASARRRKK